MMINASNGKSLSSYRLCALFFVVGFFVLVGNAPCNGVVSSATPEASAAGAEILKKGGNAVDAAVAVAFTLGVTEPAGSGLGGQTFFLVHPVDRAPFVINGTSYAPLKLPAKVTWKDVFGRRASTVPSTVRVLDHAWRNFGSGKIKWKELLAPAIRAAEQGYLLGHFRYRSLARYGRDLLADSATAEIYLGKDKSLPKLEDPVKLPLLAKALRRLAEAGADDFYKGQIAKDIAADMEANGGWITLDDLEKFPQPQVVAPLRDKYRGYDAYSLPPPTGGWVVLLGLGILERSPKDALAVQGSDRRTIWLAEALRVCHAQRAESPITNFKQYVKEAARKIDDAAVDKLLKEMQLPMRKSSGGETTHFSVVDKDGMAVGVTSSINAYFGAHVAHPKWGFLYNDYVREFTIKNTGSPYRLRSGAVPYSSMSATILAKNGKPVLVVGSPGSQRIISAVVQVVSHWVDVNAGIKSAVEAPRLHVIPDSDLFIEARQPRTSAELLLKLELRGYDVVRPLSSLYVKNFNPFFGGVHAVALDKDGWTGAADPRRDGTVAIVRKDADTGK